MTSILKYAGCSWRRAARTAYGSSPGWFCLGMPAAHNFWIASGEAGSFEVMMSRSAVCRSPLSNSRNSRARMAAHAN
eukprot:7378569-Prymnesium_polylepis.2